MSVLPFGRPFGFPLWPFFHWAARNSFDCFRSPLLRARVVEAGDGHATETSQLCLAPQETAALHQPPLTVPGKHFDMILEPASQRFLVEVLEERTRDAE